MKSPPIISGANHPYKFSKYSFTTIKAVVAAM